MLTEIALKTKVWTLLFVSVKAAIGSKKCISASALDFNVNNYQYDTSLFQMVPLLIDLLHMNLVNWLSSPRVLL